MSLRLTRNLAFMVCCALVFFAKATPSAFADCTPDFGECQFHGNEQPTVVQCLTIDRDNHYECVESSTLENLCDQACLRNCGEGGVTWDGGTYACQELDTTFMLDCGCYDREIGG